MDEKHWIIWSCKECGQQCYDSYIKLSRVDYVPLMLCRMCDLAKTKKLRKPIERCEMCLNNIGRKKYNICNKICCQDCFEKHLQPFPPAPPFDEKAYEKKLQEQSTLLYKPHNGNICFILVCCTCAILAIYILLS